MSYAYRYINKQVFQNSVTYTLLIEDTDGDEEIASYRVEKSFKVDSNQIDEEFLRKEAKLEISRIMEDAANPTILPPSEEILLLEE